MWTPRIFKEHPRISGVATFLLVFMPTYIESLWSLYEMIKDKMPDISLDWLSVNHLYLVTIPIGLYFLVAIWVQTKEPTSPAIPKSGTSHKEVSDLGKKILKTLSIPVRKKNVLPPNADELLELTKLDRLLFRVEYRALRDKNLLYEDQYDNRIRLSEEGEDYVQNELLGKDV